MRENSLLIYLNHKCQYMADSFLSAANEFGGYPMEERFDQILKDMDRLEKLFGDLRDEIKDYKG